MIDMLTRDLTWIATTLATMLPFVAFLVIMVFTRNHRGLSAGLSIGAITVSLLSAVFLLARHWHLEAPLQYLGRWLVSGDIHIPFGFLLDQTSMLMLAIVTTISFLVQIYSLGYMAGDAGFSRYYAFMSLFAWAMMNLTIAPTMVQLFIFWELVGLSSYLLIGFWYEKFSATEAGKKAFVMTRFGDVAFFLGLLLALVNLGNLNILEMNDPQVAERMSPFLITIASLLIFGGIVGKSVSASDLAAGCYGGTDTGQRLAALGHHGSRRGLSVWPPVSVFQSVGHGHGSVSRHRHHQHAAGFHHGHGQP
jgi:NADH-quinone oxidoreductase subunit L